jgi:SAM-dependent methyltransferase
MSVRALGAQLRAAGLSPRSLATWAGTDRLSALPQLLPAHVTREPVPAAVALSLFVAGVALDPERAKNLPVEQLLHAKLLAQHQGLIYAPHLILPIGPSLIVCDRLDAPDTREYVPLPDDSSYHLVGAIPAKPRRKKWLDIGCGSGFAQLALPNLADDMIAIDINPVAVKHARQGAMLSGVDRLDGRVHDVAGFAFKTGHMADLITCNAPLPDAPSQAVWRRADPGFFQALWHTIHDNLGHGGMAIVHCARRLIPADLPGERVIVAYAPDMAVVWWVPTAPERFAMLDRPLTKDRPHIDGDDRDDALDRAP